MRNISSEKARLIGYLQTDGCLRHSKKASGSYRYEISFANKESRDELLILQKSMKKYKINKTKIIGPTTDNSFILMLQNSKDLLSLEKILSGIPEERKRRLKDVIKTRGDMDA